MSKRRKTLDNPNQLKLDFDRKIETYQTAKQDALDACQETQKKEIGSRDEACVEIAVACKRAIRHSDMSREQIVDAINNYFSERRLSIHMFNNYLSKPCKYPLPSYYLYAIQYVTGSLEPVQALAEPMDARVISGAEIRHMALGKLDETILEMQRLKKELRGARL
jgi:hypothetical protein